MNRILSELRRGVVGSEATAARRGANRGPLVDFVLSHAGIDLGKKAADGEFDHLENRPYLLDQLGRSMARMMVGRHAVVVGPAGSGKTSLVQILARECVRGRAPRGLEDAALLALGLSTLLSGSNYSQFVKNFETFAEAAAAQQSPVVLFIDELHAIVDASPGGSHAVNLGNLLKPVLTSTNPAVHIVGATTAEEYAAYVRKDTAFAERFSVIRCPEPSLEEVTTMAVEMASPGGMLALHHGASIGPQAARTLVGLCESMPGAFPRKLLRILEPVLQNAHADGSDSVEQRHIEQAIRQEGFLAHRGMDVPRIYDLLLSVGSKAQPDCETALGQVAEGLHRAWQTGRPPAFLLLGHAARARVIVQCVAGALYRGKRYRWRGQRRASDEADTNRLVGSPLGYIGSDRRSPLIASLQDNPSGIAIHLVEPSLSVIPLLAGWFEDGAVTDGIGRTYPLAPNALFVSDEQAATGSPIGFAPGLCSVPQAAGNRPPVPAMYDPLEEFVLPIRV